MNAGKEDDKLTSSGRQQRRSSWPSVVVVGSGQREACDGSMAMEKSSNPFGRGSIAIVFLLSVSDLKKLACAMCIGRRKEDMKEINTEAGASGGRGREDNAAASERSSPFRVSMYAWMFARVEREGEIYMECALRHLPYIRAADGNVH